MLIFINRGETVKLDIGCGPKCKKGFIGVDYNKYNSDIKYVIDLNKNKLPFKNNKITEIYCSHTLEHLDKLFQLVHEFYRVLSPGGKCIIKVPYFRHYQAFQPHHKTFWGLGTENIFNNKYSEFEFKWSKTKLSWNFINQSEDKLWIILLPILNYIIKKYKGIYERKISLIFPIYELEFELIK